ETSPLWSRRAQARLTEVRQEHPFVHAGGPTLLSRSGGDLEWWTFAGTRANATLAGELSRLGVGRVDHDALAVPVRGAGGRCEVAAAVGELASRDPSTLTPRVAEEALEGLKFSGCLPRDVALATLESRLRDEPAARAVLGQPLRVTTA